MTFRIIQRKLDGEIRVQNRFMFLFWEETSRRSFKSITEAVDWIYESYAISSDTHLKILNISQNEKFTPLKEMP